MTKNLFFENNSFMAVLIIVFVMSILILVAIATSNKGGGYEFYNYISSIIKKCNFDKKQVKNSLKASKNTEFCKKQEIKYIPIKKEKIKNKFKKLTKIKAPIYVEQSLKRKTSELYKIVSSVESKISREKKYRAIGKRTIIENVASIYAKEILTKQSFNVFENFKNLSSLFKIYKKEAEVLNILIICNLSIYYINLYNDLKNIKRQIGKGRRIKKVKENMTPATIYGAYMFNPLSTKLFIKNKEEVFLSTTKLLNELDEIYEKEVVIYNYIKFLYKGV